MVLYCVIIFIVIVVIIVMVSKGNGGRLGGSREGGESKSGTGAGPGCEADLVGWGLVGGGGSRVAGGAVVLCGLDIVDC